MINSGDRIHIYAFSVCLSLCLSQSRGKYHHRLPYTVWNSRLQQVVPGCDLITGVSSRGGSPSRGGQQTLSPSLPSSSPSLTRLNSVGLSKITSPIEGMKGLTPFIAEKQHPRALEYPAIPPLVFSIVVLSLTPKKTFFYSDASPRPHPPPGVGMSARKEKDWVKGG